MSREVCEHGTPVGKECYECETKYETPETARLVVPDDITAMLKTLPKHLIQKISLHDIDLITKPFRLCNAELKQQIEELEGQLDLKDVEYNDIKARNAELEKVIEDAYEHLRKGLEVAK